MSTERERHSGQTANTGGISNEEAAHLWGQFLDDRGPHGMAAFDRLYRGFLPVVLRYCRSRLCHRHQAEDAANAVFVQLLRTRPVLRASVIGLLLGTARNVCAAELTRREPVRPAPDVVEDDPSCGIEQRETWAALAECLSRLPDHDQAIVVLRHGEGLSYRQIKDSLGLDEVPSTLTRRLRAIVAKLRCCLEEKDVF